MHRQNSATFILVFAAILSAFAPLTTDLYLPALPALTEAFATNASNVQLSLTFSFIGMATGQLLFGPLSDKQGRKTPLLMSLVAFVLATLGCIYAWNIESFNFFRLLQGFAGAGGLVISRSIAVDLYEEEHLARFLSSLAVINGIAPIIAPVGGGVLLDFTDWRGIFVVLLILGVCILMGGVYFKETLPVSRRLQGNMLKTYSSFGKVLRNRNYLNYTLSIGFTMGMFFAYLASSPFIFQNIYKVTPSQYGIFFAVNAVGLIIGNKLIVRFVSARQAFASASRLALATTIFIAVVLYFQWHVLVVEAAFFILLIAVGILLPAGTSLALNLERENSGSASALLGFFQFFMGGLISPLVGIGDIMLTTSITIFLTALISFYFANKAMVVSDKGQKEVIFR